jgi:hypothetical protein
MSFGAVAVAAGIIALEPAFTTGAAIGVFFAAEQMGPSRYRHYHHRRVVAGGQGLSSLLRPISPGLTPRNTMHAESHGGPELLR